MEVPGVDGVKKGEKHETSAAAFVEGGIQEACDDACSICLEAFCDNDPSSVTRCRHEFHLQCILEWCQRSSNCPMCWRPISLKDPSSQELLEAVELERSFRFTSSRNEAISHHSTVGDFELQHLQMGAGASDSELEDYIIQHLAAAAAIGRTYRISRREGPRSHSSAHTRPQFVLFSAAHPNASSAGHVSASVAAGGAETESTTTTEANPCVPPSSLQSEGPLHLPSSFRGGSLVIPNAQQGIYNDNRSLRQSSMPNQDRAGPSEFQSVSDSWKSRLNSMSMKYKDSISKSTRGWKEKLFSRTSSVADIGSEVRREVSAGIATVSRMMEHLEFGDNNMRSKSPLENNRVSSSGAEQSSHENDDTLIQTSSNGLNSSS